MASFERENDIRKPRRRIMQEVPVHGGPSLRRLDTAVVAL
jgi:hypothetical protein